jgi:predicted amidohydrolase YtcJ
LKLKLKTVLILSAFILVAGFAVLDCKQEDVGPVDLIVLNGNVYLADAAGGFAEAVAVQGNRILRVGSNQDIGRLRQENTLVIDAEGGAVLPGLIDSHVHFLSGGLALDQVNLLDAVTVERILEKIKNFADANPDRPWVEGRGWYYAPFPNAMPTRQQLDSVAPDRPALMRCYDGHTSWLNSKALELAGITRDTPNPEGGVVDKDPETGEPTGILKESAQRLVRKVLPETTRDDRLRAIRAGIEEAHRLGITSVQNADGSLESLELYNQIRSEGDLKLRVSMALSISTDLTEEGANGLEELRERFSDDPFLKTCAVKLFVDGVIESHTAVMLEPYANKPTSGVPICTAEEITRTVEMMDGRGWQILIHAIGDGGVRMALDAYENAAKVNPAPAHGRRHRIEHAETIAAVDIARFGELGVIAAMQPYHANPSPNQIDVWSANIGPDRASRAWVWKSIKDAGGEIAFGSDWPVVSIDPRIGINMALNRTTPDGHPPGGWLPEQKLPLTQVIDAYTRDAAYASFDENIKGSLAPGMLADIVIFSDDIFNLPAEKVLDAAVRTTIFDGEVVYEDK